jgi:hypothetical protein
MLLWLLRWIGVKGSTPVADFDQRLDAALRTAAAYKESREEVSTASRLPFLRKGDRER